MKSVLIYVELKTGFADNGPAWVGKGFFSRSGQTIYFNGKILKKGKGIAGNYFDIETRDQEEREEYWISGIKKNGTNRHESGTGKIQIDFIIVKEYLELTGKASLPKTFEIVSLNNNPSIETAHLLENKKLK